MANNGHLPRTIPNPSPRLSFRHNITRNETLKIVSKTRFKPNEYRCHPDELRQWLSEVMDMEVVPIVIAGPSRLGKSFLLNYMLRYLNGISNNERDVWFGRWNDKLEGFKWKADTEPETEGMWISKPYVVERSDGNKVAVVLIDTQGVFDCHSNERDWNIIVGISLLISSQFIFNLQSHLRDDTFVFLESFLENGIRASKKLSGTGGEKPFQNLLFLMRDWELPMKYSFGLGGGNDYLDSVLQVEETQNESARNARQLIRECFTNVECFLMPKIGDRVMENEFNGSIGQLAKEFKAKLKILFPHILMADNLQTKQINGSPMLVSELIDMLDNLVEVFNKGDFFDYMESRIVGLTTKIADRMQIRKIKESHFQELLSIFSNNPFVSRQTLFEQNKRLSLQYITVFENVMSSDENGLIEQMEKEFDVNCDVIYRINEERRQQIVRNTIEECKAMFTERGQAHIDTNINSDGFDYDQALSNIERQVLTKFESIYNGEQEQLFFKDRSELMEFMSKEKEMFKNTIKNKQKSKERAKTKLLDTSKELYEKRMKEMSNQRQYYSEQQFKELEEQIRNKIVEEFMAKSGTDYNRDRYSQIVLEAELKAMKKKFKKANEIKTAELTKKINNLVIKHADQYRQNVDLFMQTINSEDELKAQHRIQKCNAIKEFQKCCEDIDQQFITQFNEELKRKIKSIFSEFKQMIAEKIRVFEQAAAESFEYFKLEMSKFSPSDWSNYKEGLDSLMRTSRRAAKQSYETLISGKCSSDALKTKFQLKLQEDIESYFELFQDQLVEKLNQMKRDTEEERNKRMAKFNAKLEQILPALNHDDQFINKLTEKSLTKFEKELANKVDPIFMESAKNSFQMDLIMSLEEKKNIIKDKQEQKEIQCYIDESVCRHEQYLVYNIQTWDEFDIRKLDKENNIRITELILEFKRNIWKSRNIDDYSNELHRRLDKNYMQIRQTLIKMKESKDICLDQFKSEISSIDFDDHRFSEDLKDIRQQCKRHFNENNFDISNEIKTKISELIDQDFYQEEQKVFNMSEKLKEFIKIKMTEHLDRYEQVFQKLLSKGKQLSQSALNEVDIQEREKLINEFINSLKNNHKFTINELTIEEKSNCLDGLMRDAFEKFSGENIDLMTKNHEQLFKTAIETYKTIMNERIVIIQSEEEFNHAHLETLEMAIQHLDRSAFADHEVLESYQDKCKTEISKLRPKYMRMTEELILKKYQDIVEEFKDEYIKEMDDYFDKDVNLTSIKLQSLHQWKKNILNNELVKQFREEFDISVDNLLGDLNKFIDSEFQKFKDMFDKNRISKLENMKEEVKVFSENYGQVFDPWIAKIKDEDELKKKHDELLKKSIDDFTEIFGKNEPDDFHGCIEMLKKEIHVIYKEVFKLWLKEESTRRQMENLRLRVSKFYNDEMKRHLAQKNYHKDDEIHSYHRRTIEAAINMYRNEFKNIPESKLKAMIQECVLKIFVRFQEQNDMFRPKETHAIGVDLGTSNSAVGFFQPTDEDKYSVKIIECDFNKTTMASAVSIRDDKEEVGDVAKEELYVYPKNTITSVKRLIGRKFKDESVQKSLKNWSYKVIEDKDGNAKVQVNVNDRNQDYFPEEISAKVLAKLKKLATEHIGVEVTKAVITVPAYFTDAQKEATIRAGRLAGLEVLKIINEPTAAAIAYKLLFDLESKERKVLVYDFGGGTFDVAVLVVSQGKIEVKAVGGDNHLGGDDFDINLVNYCLQQFESENKVSLEEHDRVRAVARLKGKCEKAKIKLSATNRTEVSLKGILPNKNLKVEITREKFNEINDDLIKRSLDLVKSTLDEIKMPLSDVQDIVLVGGTTRVPRVKEELSALFSNRPLNHMVNPDEAVCVGAAIQAAMLNERQAVPLGSLSLVNVAPMSLGIELYDGSFSRLIKKNTKVPATVTQPYYTSHDNQRVVSFPVYEGEDKRVAKNNHLLGSFKLNNIPPRPRGKEKMMVTFDINDDGILHVTAESVSTGEKNDITITSLRGTMTEDQLQELMNRV